MATYQVSNTTVGINTLADFDRWIVGAGVTVDVANDHAFFGGASWEDNLFVIRGTVQTTGSFNAFHLKAQRTRVEIESSGVVESGKSGVLFVDNTCRLNNSGSIDAVAFGVQFQGDGGHLVNSGSITSDNTGVNFAGERSDLVNSGTIQGLVGVAVTGDSGRFVLDNSGTIAGSKYAYVGDTIWETLTNSGQINGDVFLRSGNDTFISHGGIVTGSVYGGNGNDTFRIDAPGLGLVEVQGGGVDTVVCAFTYTLGAFLDNLTLSGSGAVDGTGNGLANKMTGNAATNVLTGLGGRDRLSGGAGADTLNGGSYGDRLLGGTGADTLLGGAGADRLVGGYGGDRLVGEAGNDQLAGNAGPDTFVFADGHGLDRISDFTTAGPLHDVADIADISLITSFFDLKRNHMQQVGADVVIKDGANQIVLVDVQLAELTRDHFLF